MSKIGANTPLPSAELKKAVMALERMLGYAAAEALACDLGNYGIALESGRAASCTVKQLEDALKKILGSEGGVLIMDQLMKTLEKE